MPCSREIFHSKCGQETLVQEWHDHHGIAEDDGGDLVGPWDLCGCSLRIHWCTWLSKGIANGSGVWRGSVSPGRFGTWVGLSGKMLTSSLNLSSVEVSSCVALGSAGKVTWRGGMLRMLHCW